MTIVWLLVGALMGAGVATAVVWRPASSSPQPSGPAPVAPSGSTAGDRMRVAMDALQVGVVVADSEGRVVYRNPVAAGLTGSVHADVLVEEAVQSHLELGARGRTNAQVLDLYGPPRTVIVVRAQPIDDGVIVTIEDITERSLLDAVRTDFVANVSHELKTPIGAIAVLAEALTEGDDPEVVRRFAAKMVVEAHRVGRTIDELLELSRIELGGESIRQPVDIDSVIEDAVERTQSLAASHNIRIVSDQPYHVTVYGDRRQLASALGNLVENAVKYSHDGGTVSVTTAQADGHVDISVSDSGIGIPQRDLDRIFERFYRVDRARSRGTGGTGLGLAIVRHVATNHGGEVTVVSREGEGSTFTLRLAVGEPAEATGRGVPQRGPAAQQTPDDGPTDEEIP